MLYTSWILSGSLLHHYKLLVHVDEYAVFEMLLFLLRAAMKMANIDAVFEYMFTNPKKSNGVGIVYILLFS